MITLQDIAEPLLFEDEESIAPRTPQPRKTIPIPSIEPMEEEEYEELPLVKEYKGYTSETLCDAPNNVLLELLLMCHPDEQSRWSDDGRTEAYDIGRGDVLSAIQKRDDRILCDLGYPTTLKSIYVNKHTGGERQYGELVGRERRNDKKGDWEYHSSRFQFNDSENWAILEHWLPVEMADPSIHLNYLKEKLESIESDKNSYPKSERKRKLKEAELAVQMEEIKVANRKREQNKETN